MEIEVRKLVVDDVFVVARMLSKVSKAARAELATAMAAEESEVNKTELGMALFQSLFMEAEEDLKSWLANLAGQPVKDFLSLPVTAVVDIIEQLVGQEDATNFFERVSRLVPMGAKSDSTAASTSSSPDTAGETS